MIKCFGKGPGRVLGFTVWIACMAAIVWRMPTGFAPGPIAAVFVFAAPTCWFVGVLAAATYRSTARRRIARSYRQFALDHPDLDQPGSTGSWRRHRGTAVRYPGPFIDALPRWARSGLLPAPVPTPSIPLPSPSPAALADPPFIPVPKPFTEMTDVEVDRWIEDAAASMIASLPGDHGPSEEHHRA